MNAGEAGVIEAQQVKNGGVEIVQMDLILHGDAAGIAPAVAHPAFDAAGALLPGRPAELAAPKRQVTGAIFVAHLYGTELTLVQMVTTVFLSFSSPGIPSGGLLVALPLFQQLGLPAEGIGLLISADAIPDMFKPMVNVTGHMAVAVTLDPETPTPESV